MPILVYMSTDAAEAMAAMLRSREQERALEYEAKQEADARLAAFNAGKQERRKHGLIARHAAKLRRARVV